MSVQRPHFIIALMVVFLLEVYLLGANTKMAMLFPIGIGMGLALYHAAFGFTSAYRRAFVDKDLTGISAQLIMLAFAMILFAPILARGEIFGHGVEGAVAPVGWSMALGAFMFGVGMQLAGGCGSGTLFTAGGGNIRMMIVLVFFCAGGFWGSLDLHMWQTLPGIGGVSLGKSLGWWPAIVLQLTLLGVIYAVSRQLGAHNKRRLWQGFELRQIVSGPWPLLPSAMLLALFNWLTLLIAGHPWSVTWAFALWAAKATTQFGWDPHTSGFWTGGFQERALNRSLFHDTTSVMNFGIMLGAFLAASIQARVSFTLRIGMRSLAGAVLGGLLLGYGARLAYGCNIGAFFSGVASTSLHGWVWIVTALVGNWIGIRLRPHFGLSNS